MLFSSLDLHKTEQIYLGISYRQSIPKPTLNSPYASLKVCFFGPFPVSGEQNTTIINLKDMGASVLIVDDDDLLRSSLAFSLKQAGFEPYTAATAEDAIAAAARLRPDIVLLDIMLPGMDGLEALRHFRDKAGLPVIFLTARRREFDQVLGLELGADDYLTKPFDPEVLIAHIKAVLRRSRPAAPLEPKSQAVQIGELKIDARSRTVSLQGRVVELTPKEFDLLYAMALEPGRVLTIAELLARVWGAEYNGEPQIVYVNIRWLRQKIEADPQHPLYLRTVRGVGYKLVAPDGSSDEA
jgi:DNA-binding response OmpR family regulator